MDKHIHVIGIGDDGIASLSEQAKAVVKNATVLYGGERHLEFFAHFSGVRKKIGSPLTNVIAQMEIDLAAHEQIVVLASGDPLFYGIGSTLVQKLGAHQVEIVPNVSAVQLAFARAGERWQDARIVSLHGRSMRGLAQKLHGARVVALLTDGVNTPSEIAKYLLRFDMIEYEAFVAEHLGSVSERTGWFSLHQLQDTKTADLNVVILRCANDMVVPTFTLGIDDEQFAQRTPDRGLITKREVRVQSLAELALSPGEVMWDIGACTGSVSIEAILSTPELSVYAVEKNTGDLDNLLANQVKFRTDFVAVNAKAPDGLADFPSPDAVFIGGSGGELVELLQECARRLRPNGRIVVNAATIENLYEAHQTLRSLGFDVTETLLQTARSKPILNLTRFVGMNPVYLITARSKRQEEATK